MPSHYMYPVSDLDSDDIVNLSETFYGLMGGGISGTFDRFPEIFDQIQTISGVDFSEIMPIYHCLTFENERNMEGSWQDIYKVRDKFSELYNNLLCFPDFSSQIILVENGYVPFRSYFSDIIRGEIMIEFNNSINITVDRKLELLKKYYPELEEDFILLELMDTDKLEINGEEWNFGHDICSVLSFIDKEIQKGAKTIRLNGR